MGAILAKFRKEKTTYQVLETLDDKIKNIEAFGLSTQERQRRYVGNILVVSIGVYVIAFVIFYLLFFPPTWLERIIYSTPLLIFPIVIILLKRLVTWYYQVKLNRNSIKLNELRAEKKKIIEKVMDTETYKVALDILNRFNDSTQHKHTIGGKAPLTNNHTKQHHHHHHHPHNQNHKQYPTTLPNIENAPFPAVTPYRSPATTNNLSLHQRPQTRQQFSTPGGNALAKPSSFQSPAQPQPRTPQSLFGGVPNTPLSHNRGTPMSEASGGIGAQQQQQYPRTPFPIINHNHKSYVEKMVDFLIGDGLSNRYGMICKECYGHNGMASPEEYEYSAFRCAFCKTLNPARKLRPIAPKIAGIESTGASSSGKTSSSEASSSSDSEPSADVDHPKPSLTTVDASDESKPTDEKKND